jgi:hypothetical protein
VGAAGSEYWAFMRIVEIPMARRKTPRHRPNLLLISDPVIKYPFFFIYFFWNNDIQLVY